MTDSHGSRPAADSIIRYLKTTSEKIRALRNAGYDRAEISKLLGIRYQHVRKVLLDAGITGGLRREVSIPQPTILIEIPEGMELPKTPAEFLLEAGFSTAGKWNLDGEGKIGLTGEAPVDAGVYAFALDGTIVYVGLSIRGVRGRMRQYRRGDSRQKTSARINKLIKAELTAGRTVTVLAVVPENLNWHGLPVNTASGLETALIQKIRPPWNIQVGKVRTRS
jgi:hypothetical protein